MPIRLPLIEMWAVKACTSDGKENTQDILSVAESYTPGQSGIDGGGWKIMKKEPKGYLYQVFESEKIG